MITEEKLKLLLEYGMVTAEEKTRILNEYHRLGGVSDSNEEFIKILKQNVKELSEKEKELKEKEAKLLKENEELNEKIFELRKKRSEQRAEAKVIEYEEFTRLHVAALEDISYEFQRISRKRGQLVTDLRAKIEAKAVEKARQKIQ